MSGIGTVNFGGLASGLDTQQLIEDLMKVDSKPLTRLQTHQEELKEQSTVFTSLKTTLTDLKDSVTDLKSPSTFNAFSASSSDEEALNVTASSAAVSGTHSIKIIRLAQAELRSSASFASSETDLGLSGEISVNGKSVKVRTSDSLIDIRSSINNLKSGVRANILKVGDSDYRLILTAETQGAEGFTLANAGSADMLGQLGFTDGTREVREIANGKVVSDQFNASNVTLASLIGISGAASGIVQIKGQTLSVDLAEDTLATIRDRINNLGLTGVTASVDSVTEGSQVRYRLAIAGTTDFSDDGNVLETIGILAGGTSGTNAEFQFGPFTESGSGRTADDSSYLTRLGSLEGETIGITGFDADGNSIRSSYTITQDSRVRDLLSAIENAFGGDVAAAMADGNIVVRSAEAGETPITMSLTASNQNGGTLDFGTAVQTQRGWNRLIAEGADALILVDNIQVTRNTNQINDVLSGISLDLKKADRDTLLSVSVKQDTKAIKDKIQKFVDAYNKFIKFVNEKSSYDAETEKAGPLLGDMTTRTIVYRVQSAVQMVANDPDFDFTMLAQVGIELTADGALQVNSSKLENTLNQNPDAVIALFTATRTATDNDVSFVYSSSKSAPGTYSVAITRAAEQAAALSGALDDRIGSSGTLEIADDLGAGMEISYDADMALQDVADEINTEARTSYAKNIASSAVLADAEGEPVRQSSTIGDIAGVTVRENDSITISGKTRTGRSFQKTLRLTDGNSYTIQDILNQIVTKNNNNVTAAVDTQGAIVVQDNDTGASSLELSITTTIEGLSFGQFATTQEGRSRVTVDASVTDDNRLEISHTAYGSAKTFTLSGGQALGFSDGTFRGVDIAGTINGIEGTGTGNSLTASDRDTSSRGIIVSSTITPEELAVEGISQGAITLMTGVGERLYNDLSLVTQSVNGFIQTRIDSIQIESESTKTQINDMNKRLEQRKAAYVRRFTEMEKAMSQLQTLQQQLSSSLNVLPKSYS